MPSYIEYTSSDGHPFYVDMESGHSEWTIPPGVPTSAVKYIAHLTDAGIPYYENVESNEVSWDEPKLLSKPARRTSVMLSSLTKAEGEVFLTEKKMEQRPSDAGMWQFLDVVEGGKDMMTHTPFSGGTSSDDVAASRTNAHIPFSSIGEPAAQGPKTGIFGGQSAWDSSGSEGETNKNSSSPVGGHQQQQQAEEQQRSSKKGQRKQKPNFKPPPNPTKLFRKRKKKLSAKVVAAI